MNCIILLLLLSCCGGNNQCGCQCQGRGGCGSCGRSDGRDGRREGGRERERGGEKRSERRQEDNRGNNSCGQQNPSGCSCNREDSRGSQQEKSCDIPGMVPPPWQEYPQMPRREKCDCEA